MPLSSDDVLFSIALLVCIAGWAVKLYRWWLH